MNTRQAIDRAVRAGATVYEVKGTGEIKFTLAGLKPVVMNRRRKDASRAAMLFVRRCEELKTDGRRVEHGNGAEAVR